MEINKIYQGDCLEILKTIKKIYATKTILKNQVINNNYGKKNLHFKL